MGWSSYGYVFTSEPNWERLLELPIPANQLVGYKHGTLDLWLVGIASPRDRGAAAFAYFTTLDLPVNRRKLDPQTRQLLDLIGTIRNRLQTQFLDFTQAWLNQSLALAERTALPVFFFTADDSYVDVGCQVEPGKVLDFAARFTDFSLRLLEGTVRVLIPDRDRLDSFPREKLDALKDLDGVEVVIRKGLQAQAKGNSPPTRRRVTSVTGDMARWTQFYRFPVEMWPANAGDPAEVLGLGTWDLFDPFDKNFVQVYPVKKKPTKPRRT